jgi:hypothetical protein
VSGVILDTVFWTSGQVPAEHCLIDDIIHDPERRVAMEWVWDAIPSEPVSKISHSNICIHVALNLVQVFVFKRLAHPRRAPGLSHHNHESFYSILDSKG